MKFVNSFSLFQEKLEKYRLANKTQSMDKILRKNTFFYAIKEIHLSVIIYIDIDDKGKIN